MMVNTNGSIRNIFACIGSAGCGLSFCCRNMVMPMSIGQMPILSMARYPVGSQSSKPNKINRPKGSGADKSMIQPKNGAWRTSMVTRTTI